MMFTKNTNTYNTSIASSGVKSSSDIMMEME